MKRIAVLIVLVGIGVGIYFFLKRPFELPDLKMKSAGGEPVDLDQLYQEREYLLLVFALPRCPISEFSLGMLKGLYPRFSEQVAFAGLVHGNQQAASELQAKFEIPFPLYGLRDAANPFAIQELFEKVGGGTVTGGTVLVADGKRKVRILLAKEELVQLAVKLEKLLE